MAADLAPGVFNFLMSTTPLRPAMVRSGVRINIDTAVTWIRLFARNIERSEPFLTNLDRSIGDGDHGFNLRRGLRVALSELEEFTAPDISGYLRSVSSSIMSSVGGASGPLYGVFFLHAAHSCVGKTELALADIHMLVEDGCLGVIQLGKAAIGDKTMVDTLCAGTESLRNSCVNRISLPQAMLACVESTRDAMRGTTPMLARKGRASYLGERSIGFQDPGATSAHLMFTALAEACAPAISMTDTTALKPKPANV
jgi:dihydroxyacetone kinase-like protein